MTTRVIGNGEGRGLVRRGGCVARGARVAGLTGGLVLLLLAVGGAGVPAMPDGEETGVRQVMTAAQPGAMREAWDRATVTITFGGGTVKAYVEALRGAVGDVPVNVAFAGGADGVQVPAVSLRGVGIETAIYALAGLFQAGPEVRLTVQEVVPRPGTPVVVGPGMPRSPGVPMFIVGLEHAGGARERQTNVISLNPVIMRGPGSPPAEVVLTAIETGLKGVGAGADLKFHKDSGLLFVTGERRQCQVAMEVVEQMVRDLDPMRGRSGKPKLEEFALAHASPSTVIDVLRLAFPPRPDQPADVTASPANEGRGVVVTAPDHLMVAARALVRYVDMRPDANPMTAELRMAREEQARRAEVAERAAQEARSQAARMADDTVKMRREQEAAAARAEELAAQAKQARDQSTELRRQIEALAAEVERLERQQRERTKEPGTPR